MSTMTFVKLDPKRTRFFKDNKDDSTRKIIRASFHNVYSKGHTEAVGKSLILYIGKEVAESIGIKPNDRIAFHIEQNNPRIWYIERSQDETGYKASDVKQANGSTTGALRITRMWKEFDVQDEDMRLRKVQFDRYHRGIRIFFLN